jgi:hypothetical protein
MSRPAGRNGFAVRARKVLPPSLPSRERDSNKAMPLHALFAELAENGTQWRDLDTLVAGNLGRKSVQPFVNRRDNLLCIGLIFTGAVKVALGPEAITFPLCTSMEGGCFASGEG